MDKQAAVEATMDTIEPVIDTIEAVPEVVRNNPAVLASVAVVSASIGATVAVVITRKILKTKYERLIAQEVQEAKAHYQRRYKEGKYADPTLLADDIDDDEPDELNPETAMVKEAARLLEKEKYVPYDKVSPADPSVNVEHAEVTVEQTNIFIENADDGGFDLDEELDKKSAGKPYIIEQEQFLENEDEFTQVTLTWYEGDNTLVDEQERAVRNYEPIIGDDNLKFGHGSRDPNTVYIRNFRLKADYEVVRSEMAYAQHVLGLGEPKERRSAKPKKFPRDAD